VLPISLILRSIVDQFVNKSVKVRSDTNNMIISQIIAAINLESLLDGFIVTKLITFIEEL
jgi:hypothetical protein